MKESKFATTEQTIYKLRRLGEGLIRCAMRRIVSMPSSP